MDENKHFIIIFLFISYKKKKERTIPLLILFTKLSFVHILHIIQ